MTIPHNIRRMAQAAYKHTLYTGRNQSSFKGHVATVMLDENAVRVTDTERLHYWIVPIAASWL